MRTMTRHDIYTADQKPASPEVNLGGVPESLRRESRWVAWDYVRRQGRWAKVPKDARTGGPGSSTDPNTWCDFQAAYDAYRTGRFDGVGYVLGDGWMGVDLDECRNPVGVLTPLAQEVVESLDTYTETSPSGTGVKLILRGELPERHRTKNQAGTVEVYSTGRYFCVTGDIIHGAEVEDRQQEIEAAWRQYIGSEVRQQAVTAEGSVNWACHDAMLRIPPRDGENDGSKRLLAWQCRAVSHNLTIESARATVREAAKTCPFPSTLTDADIDRRYEEAEARDDVVRGSETTIRVGPDVGRVMSESVAALACSDVYQNSDNLLTRYLNNPEPCKYALLDNGAPRLGLIPAGALLEVLCEAARWEYFAKEEWVQRRPDPELRAAILNRQNYPGVKVAYGVVSAPILLPNGRMVTTPGYNADSGLILSIDGDWPDVMDNPTALEKLRYVFGDFPFADESHESACLAALLTLLSRNLIGGNTPFFPFDGNRPGCGKGLATDAITMIAEGRRASRYSYTGNKDELRKTLTTLAMEGRTYLLFDNITGRFGDSVLEAAMTTGRISDRVLGASKSVDLPLFITWLGTVNGMTYDRDMMRRSVPVMLDTTEENPQLREGFREPDLLGYVAEHRRELHIAALSIVANFLRDGRPVQVAPFGSFNEWSQLIRGALIYARMADPCEHCAELYANLSDDVASSTDNLLAAWQFNEPVTVKRALQMLDEHPKHFEPLQALLHTNDTDANDAEFLGKLLRGAKGQVHEGRCVTHTGGKRPRWFVETVMNTNNDEE